MSDIFNPLNSSEIFPESQNLPGPPAFLAFMSNALFDRTVEYDHETVRITGQVGGQDTIGALGQQIFEQFEKDDNTTILVGEHGQLILLFDEPRDGVRRVEFHIHKSE